jgi:type III restriction enzyme
MDKGAHYYRCDFQVHSPRDRAWTGNKFGVDPESLDTLTPEGKKQIIDDRIQFAREYLEKARNAGLNAIAITDHHDVTSVKLIRKVAHEENVSFTESNQFEKTITVFPGIELSLANPASQCLVIFDADFPDANLDAVLNFIGIVPSNDYEKFTVPTQRISQTIINDLGHLHEKLDEFGCKGRYIILPHVGHNGQHSILRQGFHEHYRKMPCVGGYVDKDISTDAGYQNKINGGDVNYGNKSIALLSTSDNRYEDGREFGKYATWIKWAEPTAEAIRQACLAKESRISQTEPELPQVFINSIDVTASKFLGSFNINLNEQYNALIGGRGTGKSTILEYLRWGLCDQTMKDSSYEEMSVIELRRKTLIEKTLGAVGGEVRITMQKNGVLHVVKRSSVSKEILLKIGDGEFQQVKEDDIRKILPVQSYSQKQLSDVGVKTEELKRFIEQPITGQLDSIRFLLNESGLKLKSSYNQLIRKKELEQEVENFNLESQSLETQVDNIRKSLKGVSEEDQKTINKKPKFDREETVVNNVEGELRLFEGKADDLLKLLEKYPEPFGNLDDFENQKLIRDISEEVQVKFKAINDAVSALKNVFGKDQLTKLNSLITDWRANKFQFELDYDTAKNQSQSSQQQLAEIQRIENRITEINKIVAERKSLLKEIGNPEEVFDAQILSWSKLHKDKVALLNDQALRFTALSRNLIKAEVTKSINLTPFKTQIKNILEGTRIREERVDALIDHIKSAENPLKEYTSIIEELRLLAELKVSEDKTFKLPESPILTACGFSDEHKSKICGKINTGNWLLLAAAPVEFDPEFYYNTNNTLGDSIPFANASAGQQATALLTVLLNQPGMPLLIDQPEDDIDNRAIDQIIRNIWDAKKKRQLIFTSHNANLVVNGDAELVVCCDYKDSNSQTRGIIKAEGAIDTKAVRSEITAIMEGGEKAFKLRMEKYGF